jgi:hypothetical protein
LQNWKKNHQKVLLFLVVDNRTQHLSLCRLSTFKWLYIHAPYKHFDDLYRVKCKDNSLLNKIIQSLYICKPQFTINLMFSFTHFTIHKFVQNNESWNELIDVVFTSTSKGDNRRSQLYQCLPSTC